MTPKGFSEYLTDTLDLREIVSAVIAIALVATICAMSYVGRSIQQELWSALLLVLGFYFGFTTGNRG